VILAAAFFQSGIVFQKNRQKKRLTEQSWLKSYYVDMPVILGAVNQAAQDRNFCEKPTLNYLVERGFLPELSEIYVCPDWSDISLPPKIYDDNFRKDVFKESAVLTSYKKSPYFLERSKNTIYVRSMQFPSIMDFNKELPTDQK